MRRGIRWTDAFLSDQTWYTICILPPADPFRGVNDGGLFFEGDFKNVAKKAFPRNNIYGFRRTVPVGGPWECSSGTQLSME